MGFQLPTSTGEFTGFLPPPTGTTTPQKSNELIPKISKHDAIFKWFCYRLSKPPSFWVSMLIKGYTHFFSGVYGCLQK